MSFKKIVFASTFKENVQEAFEKVRKFALTFQSEIELLYINLPYNFEETHRSQSRMNEFVALYPGLNFKTHIYNAFDEESGILKYAKENQADLIAVVTHGKSSFAQMLSPSICESLACNSEIPVLSVHI